MGIKPKLFIFPCCCVFARHTDVLAPCLLLVPVNPRKFSTFFSVVTEHCDDGNGEVPAYPDPTTHGTPYHLEIERGHRSAQNISVRGVILRLVTGAKLLGSSTGSKLVTPYVRGQGFSLSPGDGKQGTAHVGRDTWCAG